MEASITWGHPRQTSAVHRIVVANDASAAANNAVAIADVVAARCQANLTIANHETQLQPLHAYRTPRSSRSSRQSSGDLVDAMVRASAQNDILVIGALGADAVERDARSHVALRIAARALSSVWIDRREAVRQGLLCQPRRILVGVSHSDSSIRALELAAELAARLDAELTVAGIVPLASLTLSDAAASRAEDYTSAVMVSAHAKLKSAVDRLRSQVARHILVPIGDAADVLVALAAGFDLVVVGSGRSLEQPSLHIGGVASRVAIDAETSVLIAR